MLRDTPARRIADLLDLAWVEAYALNRGLPRWWREGGDAPATAEDWRELAALFEVEIARSRDYLASEEGEEAECCLRRCVGDFLERARLAEAADNA